MKGFSVWKHRREYLRELVRIPYFWVGVVLVFLSAMIIMFSGYGIIKVPAYTDLFVFAMGFILIVSCKHRILGRLEERHFKGK